MQTVPGTDGRLTDAEALLWSADADPALRSAFMSVTFLEQAPDFERLRRRVTGALADLPALSHRIVDSSFLDIRGPRWEPDPGFDLDFHLRRVAVPAPGDDRQVLDLAALLCQDPFDRTRPLWQFTVVEGLAGGRAALLSKMHHVISDGIGAVRMSATFLDLGPDDMPASRRRRGPASGPAPVDGTAGGAPADGDAGAGPGAWRGAASGVLGTLRTSLELPRRVAGGVTAGVTGSVAMGQSMARQFTVFDPARSPLWTGRRALAHRLEILSVDLGEVKAAAGRLGGTVNDVLVTAVTGAAGEYHRRRACPVGDLRMSMPVSVRRDHASGGNAWIPTRVLVPAGERDPRARFALVHERLAATKREPSLGLTDAVVTVVRSLPAPLVVRLARQQAGTVDFACSNVRGAPFELWVAGARVLSNHPMGPTAGTAFNATVLSYRDRLDLGLNADVGAVQDPAELRDLIAEGFAEVCSA